VLTCRILIELEGSDEPAWTYLEYQHAHILDTMRSMHSKSLEKVKREFVISLHRVMLRIVATRICAEQPSSSNSHIESLKKQLATSQYHVHPTNRKPTACSFGISNEQLLLSRLLGWKLINSSEPNLNISPGPSLGSGRSPKPAWMASTARSVHNLLIGIEEADK
jgi:hypothetical protein